MYITAPSPYVFMVILLIRGVTLPGAVNGIYYYLVPTWNKLADPQVSPPIKLTCVKCIAVLCRCGLTLELRSSSRRQLAWGLLSHSAATIASGTIAGSRCHCMQSLLHLNAPMYSLTQEVLIALSYCRDCIIYTFVNCGTSFLAGFVIFSVLGFMAYERGLSVGDVAESG
jgi:solute carrier family 6 GABA transporter-like protein 6/8/11/12/13